MKLRTVLAGSLLLLILASPLGYPVQAASQPFQLEAETIEYNAKTGQMVASGNNGVKLRQGTLNIRGDQAVYNSNQQRGTLTGNVQAVRDNALLTANQLEFSEAGQQLIATGNVSLIRDQDKVHAAKIIYYDQRQMAVAETGARLVTSDAILTADRLETFFADQHTVATGNVKIDGTDGNFTATADHAVYYQAAAGNQAKVVLTGNATAVQSGHQVSGQSLTLYLDDKAVDAVGQTKIIITPQAG